MCGKDGMVGCLQRIQKGLGFKSPAQVFQDFYRQAA